jgi:DNA-nicking Smr family endonuclease
MVKEEKSIYQVFSDLSHFMKERSLSGPDEKSTLTTSCLPPPKREPTEEEMFREAMSDVERLSQRERHVRVKRADVNEVIVHREQAVTMKDMLTEASRLNVVNLPEYMEGYVDDINPLIMEKLRNGDFSVQRTLDLHGLSVEGAHETFHEFLKDAVQSQICCVKVVHGRGLKSVKGPVLKEQLKGWIVRAMHRKWIVAFANAKMADGGPGATIILLRTRARKARLHITG